MMWVELMMTDLLGRVTHAYETSAELVNGRAEWLGPALQLAEALGPAVELSTGDLVPRDDSELLSWVRSRADVAARDEWRRGVLLVGADGRLAVYGGRGQVIASDGQALVLVRQADMTRFSEGYPLPGLTRSPVR